MQDILLLDVPNLVHRNWHSLFTLEENTRCIYGLLRDLGTLCNTLHSTKFVFCFDGKEGIRKELYPAYKATRTEQSAVNKWLDLIREDVLPELGYKNILYDPQWEADDFIAHVCQTRAPMQKCIIVSNDQDLYQCLDTDKVRIWNVFSKSFVTDFIINQKYGLRPDQWAMAKAIAGCKSDNIAGVPGVGPNKARDYILKTISTTSKAYTNIEALKELIVTNLKLVTLPCPEIKVLPSIKLEFPEMYVCDWVKVCQKYNCNL